MLRQVILLLVMTVPSQAQAVALAPDPETLKRTDKWVVDYDQDSCHLMAKFGAAAALRFTRYEPGDHFALTVFGKPFKTRGGTAEAKVDFGVGAGPVKLQGMNGSIGQVAAVMLDSTRLDGMRGKPEGRSLPGIVPAMEARVTGLTVSVDQKRPVHLLFGSLARPFEQLRACTADLVKHWGYDPAEQAALTRRVRPANSPAKWIRSADYPRNALSARQNGVVQFRLDVNPTGAIAGCYVLARTNPDAFADQTCKLLRSRAKLVPALDARGRPVRSYFISKVSFVIWGS